MTALLSVSATASTHFMARRGYVSSVRSGVRIIDAAFVGTSGRSSSSGS